MKKNILTMFICLFLMSSICSASNVVGFDVSMRNNHSITSDIIKYLNDGDYVQIINQWYCNQPNEAVLTQNGL